MRVREVGVKPKRDGVEAELRARVLGVQDLAVEGGTPRELGGIGRVERALVPRCAVGAVE